LSRQLRKTRCGRTGSNRVPRPKNRLCEHWTKSGLRQTRICIIQVLRRSVTMPTSLTGNANGADHRSAPRRNVEFQNNRAYSGCVFGLRRWARRELLRFCRLANTFLSVRAARLVRIVAPSFARANASTRADLAFFMHLCVLPVNALPVVFASVWFSCAWASAARSSLRFDASTFATSSAMAT
jgi:hypothetical protein